MTATVFAVFVSAPINASAGTAHAPIYINGDAEFLGPYPNADGVIGGSGTEADPYVISGWDITVSSGTGITVYYTSVYFVIKNCNVSGATFWQGVDLEYNSHGNVSNCNLIGNYYGIYAYNSPVEAYNNTISGGYYGIESDYSSSVVVRGNNFSSMNGHGVNSYRNDFLVVRECNFSNINNQGINVYDTNKVNIVNNTMNDVYCGIYLSDNQGGNSAVLGNDISTCSWTAIYANQISNLKIIGNNLTDSGQTPYIEYCSDVQVFHNNIDYDSGYVSMSSAHTWDNGYPSGGNYWVTASHVDAMSGVDQDVPGSDGICDTPVSFWDGAVDNYPLFTWFSGNIEPVASFTLGKRIINTTTALEMNASTSIDVEDPLSALQFRWDYEGDMTWDTGYSSTKNQSHTYATEGNYSVRLEVLDSGGLTSISSMDIIVSAKAHDPIHINFDSGFTDPNATTGVTTGSGTIDDPYVISDWVIEASDNPGIYIYDTSMYFIIRDCQIYFGEGSYTGITLESVDNARIETCTMMMNNYGFEAYFCDNVYVTGCVITNNQAEGMYLYLSSNVLISGNNVSSNNNGIYMYQTGDCIVADNNVSHSIQDGITVYYSSNDTLLRNNVSYNPNYGVHTEYSEQINIVRNEMIENSQGIYAYRVNILNVVGNNISGTSSSGIDIQSSGSALVHHNNFIGLNSYANDIGASTWDVGYPMGGNYWDIYVSPDNFNGPNQDVAGSDGIVDTPYSWDADSQDNYPLTTPFNMSNLPPIAAITASARILNTSTALDLGASDSFDVEDPLTALEVRWDWEGDGSWDTTWSTTKNGSHTYATAGIYSATLEVRDTKGLSTLATRTVIVSDTYRPTNIHINGNSEFDVAHGVNGGGDGSASNPYVIQNYILDATNEYGVWIEDTDKYFRIQNVQVFFGFGDSEYGIYLDHVQNGTITLSSLNNSYYGIYAYYSGNLSISDCEFDDCYRSMYLYQTDFVLIDHISSDRTMDNSLHFWSSCDYITVQNSYINKTNSAAINLGGSYPHDIIISKNVINSANSGVYADSARQLMIQDNGIHNISFGLEIYYSDGVTISGNNEISWSSSAMYLYETDNVLISNNVMTSVQYGIRTNYVNQLIIEDNNVTATSYGIYLQYSNGVTISRNEVFGSSSGIYLYDVDNALIEYCYINATTSQSIYLYYPTYVMVDNCYFEGNMNGIRIRYGNYVMVSNSTGKDVGYGVRVQDSTYISVRYNNFSGTTSNGVYMSSTVDQFEIVENNLSGSSIGIYAISSTNMNIEENIMLNNSNSGVQLSSCTGGNFRNNSLITAVSYGLYLTNCNGFKIASNNFIGNPNQAYDDTGGNSWNETALFGGGNYWSNYTYPDYNLDGFGDTPAIIDGDSIDYLPLMTPWVGNKAPVAAFTVNPSSANISVSISFDASSSTDNEDATADLEVRWDWTNDGTYDTTWSTTKTATHSYTTPGTKTIKLEVLDTGGKTDTITHTVTISEGAPVTTAALSGTAGQNGWYTSSVLVNLTATDDYSGVQWTKYKIDSGAWTTYTANLSMSSDGTFVVQYYSQDVSAINETTKSVTVKIDSVAPTISINQSAGMEVTKNYVVISWLGSDTMSGINRFEVSIDGGAYVSVSSDMSYNFTALADGSHNVTVKAVDNAGHESTATLQLTVDTSGTGGGGAISGDLMMYLLIIVIIIVVLIIVAVMLKRRGKKPAEVTPPLPEPPAPPAN